MKISALLTLFPLLSPVPALSGTVLYTDSHHPTTKHDASVSVIYLDEPERLQAKLFGKLSDNPKQAEQQAQVVLQSPQWQSQQQQMVTAYSDVVHAWEIVFMP